MTFHLRCWIKTALTESSGLAENPIIEMCNAFIADNPKGRMTPKYFREMISQVLPKKDVSKMEKHIFRIMMQTRMGLLTLRSL